MKTNKMTKIAILGKANSGKNTAAELISAAFGLEIGQEVAIKAFADPIKAMVMQMFPWADEYCLWGPSKLRNQVIPNAFDQEKQPLTYRKVLIDLGKKGRAYDPDHWVKVFDYWFRHTWHINSKLLICPDVRFQNEVDYLKANKFHLIKITRDVHSTIDDVSETSQDQISSAEFDFTLNNNGTLQDLRDNIQKFVATIQ